MDRYLALSALAAAAIHGGVLFGVSRGDAPRAMAKAIPDEVVRIVPPIVDEEPLHAPSEPGEAAPTKGTPRPTSAEQPTIGPARFPIPVVPVPAVATGPLRHIPLDPPGVEDGVGDIKRNGVVSLSDLDSAPRTRAQPAPIYPFEKRRTGERGEVTVEFTVDEAGRVAGARVTHASDRAFEAAALQAIAKWRFEPGRRHGRVVGFRMSQTFVFTLSDG